MNNYLNALTYTQFTKRSCVLWCTLACVVIYTVQACSPIKTSMTYAVVNIYKINFGNDINNSNAVSTTSQRRIGNVPLLLYPKCSNKNPAIDWLSVSNGLSAEKKWKGCFFTRKLGRAIKILLSKQNSIFTF